MAMCEDSCEHVASKREGIGRVAEIACDSIHNELHVWHLNARSCCTESQMQGRNDGDMHGACSQLALDMFPAAARNACYALLAECSR